MEEESVTEAWGPADKQHPPPITKSHCESTLAECAGSEAPQFTRGSYRKYMNQLIRGNSDTEISNDKPFLHDRDRPKSAVFGRDQLRQAHRDAKVLSAVPRYVSAIEIDSNLSHSNNLDGSNDTIHNSEENVFASGSARDVFSPVRRAVASWSGRRKSASACSDMTASTETLVGRDDSSDDSASAGGLTECECRRVSESESASGSRTRRTGAVTTSGQPGEISPVTTGDEASSGSSRVEALIQKYTQLIQQHMESSASKPHRRTVRSSLPNLESAVLGKLESIKKENLCRKLRKFSLTLEKHSSMGNSQTSSSGNSPTYLALPSFRKNKRRSSTSPSSVSDEGCSVMALGSTESPASPVSSDEGHEWSGVDAMKRCTSSDSAVECADNSEDEESRTLSGSLGEPVENAIDIPKRQITDDPELASSSKTYLLNEVDSGDRNDIELRSDRWFIEHYGSSVLERLNERKTEAWVADMGEMNLDRRMSEVDSIEGIDPGTERRESNLSCFTDDDEHPGYRYFRTPSVVVSDHSDDPAFASSSITLEEIERFRKEYAERQNSIGDSSSDCSLTSSWSNVYSTISALDAEFVLRTPERKSSNCSSCSTLSGDEDPNCEQVLQDVRTQNKVSSASSTTKVD